MKRRQRFITMMFLLGVCMLAKAGDVNQVGSIWYDIDISTKTASVVANPTGGKYVGEVNIPATINFDGTVRVIAIGADAFKSSTLLTKVTMTSQITSIGKSAFDGCTALEEVSGYTNVTSIGQYAFSGCSKLTEFHIYSALTTVGKSAFYNCTGLQAVYAEEMGTFGSINFTNDN
ncbi:MAG: leucine-rich repeat domain-containing protein, partial [Prevotella sp.]|nr:leucine-rich repeat domain-containing protein [Prevotella sp.]